jgi:hypothetical protein
MSQTAADPGSPTDITVLRKGVIAAAGRMTPGESAMTTRIPVAARKIAVEDHHAATLPASVTTIEIMTVATRTPIAAGIPGQALRTMNLNEVARLNRAAATMTSKTTAGRAAAAAAGMAIRGDMRKQPSGAGSIGAGAHAGLHRRAVTKMSVAGPVPDPVARVPRAVGDGMAIPKAILGHRNKGGLTAVVGREAGAHVTVVQDVRIADRRYGGRRKEEGERPSDELGR